VATAFDKNIPFSEPTVGEAEYAAMRQAIEARSLEGDGRLCRAAERLLCRMFDVRHALLTTSCTHALELAMMTLDIKPVDEVILPSFTFASTANVVVRQGAVPVFVDIDPDTYNLDPSLVEAAITRRTKVILPVHYAGQGCDMDAINRIAKDHRLYVIEDAAQGVGACWDGRALGTIGDIGCYSLHATKNVTCGEGGAFLTNDDALARRAEVIREKGTNRAAFLRGEIDKYSWVGLGSSFVLTDILAGFLRVQLERSGALNALRLRLWKRYYDSTADLEAAGLVKRPSIHPKAIHNGHLFALLIEDGRRNEIIDAMKSRGVRCTFHYVPLHSSPFMREYFGATIPHLPVTDRVSNSLLRLPLFAHLTEDDADYVLDRLHEAFDGDGGQIAFGLRPIK